MKRILVAIALAILCVACCPQQNQKSDVLEDVGQWLDSNGLVTTAAAATVTDRNETQYKRGHVTSVVHGENIKVCRAYYGEFNGHTWYVFYDNLAAPAVVHDPLCKCKEKTYDTLE
jgi:hypothetical protein